jgi:hypothetical protein
MEKKPEGDSWHCLFKFFYVLEIQRYILYILPFFLKIHVHALKESFFSPKVYLKPLPVSAKHTIHL